MLRVIKKHRIIPTDFKSKEDKNKVYKINLDKSRLKATKEYI